MRNSDPELSTPRWPRWVRLVLVLAVGLGVVVPAAVVLAFVSFAGGRFGWVFTMLAFGAIGLAVGWLAVSREWARARRYTALGLGAALAVGGIVTAHFAPPTESRLRDAIIDVAQPSWRLDHEYASGDAVCFDYCTEVMREYHVDGDLASVANEVGRAVARLHCDQPGSPEAIRVRWDCRKGDDIVFVVEVGSGPNLGVVVVTAKSG